MNKKKLLVFVLIIVFLSLFSVYYPVLSGKIIKNFDKETCFVDRVIDGDTLVCDNETIRLLGIDTPERGEEYYLEAKDFLRKVEGEEILLLRDWDDRGKYQRKLRYVIYENRLINVDILGNGLGKSFMLGGLEYKKELLVAENFARNKGNGVWEEM